MPIRSVSSRFAQTLGLSAESIGVLGPLLLLAPVTLSISVILDTLATALFLHEHGVSRLPVVYLILAAVLLPAMFVVDAALRRWSARQLLLVLLIGMAGLVALLWMGATVAFAYASTIGLVLAHLYGLVLLLLFREWAGGYLASSESSRNIPTMAMVLAAGGIAGGLMAMAMVATWSPADSLLAVTVGCLIAALLASVLIREAGVTSAPTAVDVGFRSQVGIVDILQHDPMVRYLGLGTALYCLCFCLTEYVVFGIYATRYQDAAELAGFLGLLFAGMQLLEIGVLLLLARHLLDGIGPLTRNLLYPGFTIAAVGALNVVQSLATAVVAHVNYRALYNAVFSAVNGVNYWAVQQNNITRARLLIRAVVLPASLAVSGALLLVMQASVAPEAIPGVALVAAILYLAGGLVLGLAYLPAMLRNLNAGVLDLRRLEALPSEVEDRVIPYFASGDPSEKQLAMDILGRMSVRGLLQVSRQVVATLDHAELDELAGIVLSRAPGTDIATLIAASPETGIDKYFDLELAIGSGLDVGWAQGVLPPDPAVQALWEILVATKAQNKAHLTSAIARNPATVSACLRETSAPFLRTTFLEYIEKNPVRLIDYLVPLTQLAHTQPERVYRIAMDDLMTGKRIETALTLLSRVRIQPADLPVFLDLLKDATRPQERMIYDALKRLVLRPEVGEFLAARTGSSRTRDHLQALRLLEYLPAANRGDHIAPVVRYYRDQWVLLWGLDQVTFDFAVCIEEFRLRARQALRQCIILLEPNAGLQLVRALAADRPVAGTGTTDLLALSPSARDIVRLLDELNEFAEFKVAATPSAQLEGLAFADYWLQLARQKTLKLPREINMDHILFLKKVPLFSELDFDTLQALSEVFIALRLDAAETVFREGEPGGHLFLVQSGKVELSSAGHLLAEVGSGGFFGEMALVDSSVRSATAVCTEDTVFLTLERQAFFELTEYHPQVLRTLNALLADRIRDLNARTVALRNESAAT